MLCLRMLQAAMVYINTLMLQHELTTPAWSDALTVEDRRGLTPLIWRTWGTAKIRRKPAIAPVEAARAWVRAGKWPRGPSSWSGRWLGGLR